MLNLLNRLFGTAAFLMEGEPGGTGGSGAPSLIPASDPGGGAPSGGGDGGSGGDPTGGKPPGDAGAGNPPGGNAPADWKSTLPKELQDNETLKRFKSPTDVAAAYINAQKLISGDKMPVPNKDWTDSDWQNFHKKAGLPESVDKYEVKFKDGVAIEPDFVKQFKENAHKAGILPKQAQHLAEWFSDITKSSESEMIAQQKKQFDTGVAELRNEWGNAFDLNIARANKLIKELGAVDHFQKNGYGSDPILMKHLANLAKEKYKDASIVEGHQNGAGAARTPGEIDAEIGRMQMDPAYNSNSHPGHKAAVEKMSALHQEKFAAKKLT